jgi:hypothetical protein
MLDLHQDVKSAFESEQFSIRQKPGKFNGVWPDMATEKTVIRDSKGRGGIVGITRQRSALIRWTLCRHVLADFSVEMRTNVLNALKLIRCNKAMSSCISTVEE